MILGKAWILIAILTSILWGANIVWLAMDSRPPAWDMALHQSYALNYLTEWQKESIPYAERSGNYPPLVHLFIATIFYLFGPSSDVAPLVNLPATILLLWSTYELGKELAGRGAAIWASIIAALTPFTIVISRETLLDYWLAAWFMAALVVLRRTRGFESGRFSWLLGAILALGMLTKWLFAGFIAFPLIYVAWRHQIWRSEQRMIYFIDALLIASLAAGIWYLPNMSRLLSFYGSNMEIGAREGEPPVFTFQSAIYYLRLLEGYQLFGILFALLAVAVIFVVRKRLIVHGSFLIVSVFGGWLAMTLLRTKDPRFTLPLLGLLAIPCGAWIYSWGKGSKAQAAKIFLVLLLLMQAYAVSFGIAWLPEEVVLVRGYQGSLEWNWNLYIQHYFHILEKPRRENWMQLEILRDMDQHARQNQVFASIALVPDLPRFNAANFLLSARLERIDVVVDHLQAEATSILAFDGFNYVVMTEREQGEQWTTIHSRNLNQIIVDHPTIFKLINLYSLPNNDSARLYFIKRNGDTRAISPSQSSCANIRSPDMVSVIPVRFFQDGSSICPDFTGIETRWRKKADRFWSAPMSAKRAIIQGLWGYVRRSEHRRYSRERELNFW